MLMLCLTVRIFKTYTFPMFGQPQAHLCVILAADYPETLRDDNPRTNRLFLTLRGETLLERDLRLFHPHVVISTNKPELFENADTFPAPALPGKAQAIRSIVQGFANVGRFHILMGDVWYSETDSALILALAHPICFFGDGTGNFALSFDADQAFRVTEACTKAIAQSGKNPRMAGMAALRTILNHDAHYEFIKGSRDFDTLDEVEAFNAVPVPPHNPQTNPTTSVHCSPA